PFTARTAASVQKEKPYNMLPFVKVEAPHGRISDEAYREFLREIEATIRSCGFDTVLPHRDVNEWGDRVVMPEDAANECTKHVFGSDVLVTFPGTSLGAHYEMGIAIGYGIPVILLKCEGEEI